MGVSGLSQLPPSVRAVLGTGEEPLAWETVAIWGEDRIGRTGPVRAVTGVDLNPVSAIASGPIDVDDGLFERWLGGVALTGPADSDAARLGRTLQREGQARLAVTTRRLILFREGETTFGTDPATRRRTWDSETTELWSAPRDHVRTAARRSRPFMVGRLLVEFADGSTVVLMCGVVSPRPAHRLRAALLGDRKG